ncbi:FAD-dependent oxidoreductase, partial [Klebsiella pneumoniae]|uniref:FAD-dependent oxidoreductase n=1 Tax=Klebsiella pneumoniae TaxID=573 RepID=UPI00210EF862
HVVEMAPRLMPAQLDEGAAALLRREVEQLGIRIHTGVRTRALTGDDPDDECATVCTLEREDEAPIPADMVVFSAGIRPRDQLARDAGLEVGER